jgi:hypothetical protein
MRAIQIHAIATVAVAEVDVDAVAHNLKVAKGAM